MPLHKVSNEITNVRISINRLKIDLNPIIYVLKEWQCSLSELIAVGKLLFSVNWL